VLYYDGECPICRTEVNRLRRLAAPSLSYQDINQASETALDKETLFSELHLQRADGSWATGLDANIIAWQHTSLRPLATLLTLPVVSSIARFGYRLWLHWYQRQRNKRQQSLRPTPNPRPR
jgi:predicted DCC family thiol-disulfide oxidoreductase YuxK